MDIKISLEIGLSPALEGFLGKFLGAAPKATPQRSDTTGAASIEQFPGDQIAAEVQRQEAEGPQPQGEAQRRTRRTKEQMAADAAATNAASTGKTVDGAADAEATATEIAEAGGATDLAAALGVEEPKTESRAGVTEKADVAAKMQAAMAAASPKKVQDAMIEHLHGAKNLSTLDPKDYAAAIDLFDKIIAG